MAISPFTARPASPQSERRRARLVVLIATLGIAATLLAYAISPSVRHAVGHAAHSVKRAVSRVLDHDRATHPVHKRLVKPANPAPTHARTQTHTRTQSHADAHVRSPAGAVGASAGP